MKNKVISMSLAAAVAAGGGVVGYLEISDSRRQQTTYVCTNGEIPRPVAYKLGERRSGGHWQVPSVSPCWVFKGDFE